MDELLRTSGLENEFVTRSLKHWVKTLTNGGHSEKIWLHADCVAQAIKSFTAEPCSG